MFGREATTEDVELDAAILRLLRDMDTYGPDSPEYTTMLEHLTKLTDVRREKKRAKISLDTVIQSAAGLLGIVAIVAYEQKHVMASKAMTLLGRTKL